MEAEHGAICQRHIGVADVGCDRPGHGQVRRREARIERDRRAGHGPGVLGADLWSAATHRRACGIRSTAAQYRSALDIVIRQGLPLMMPWAIFALGGVRAGRPHGDAVVHAAVRRRGAAPPEVHRGRDDRRCGDHHGQAGRRSGTTAPADPLALPHRRLDQRGRWGDLPACRPGGPESSVIARPLPRVPASPGCVAGLRRAGASLFTVPPAVRRRGGLRLAQIQPWRGTITARCLGPASAGRRTARAVVDMPQRVRTPSPAASRWTARGPGACRRLRQPAELAGRVRDRVPGRDRRHRQLQRQAWPDTLPRPVSGSWRLTGPTGRTADRLRAG